VFAPQQQSISKEQLLTQLENALYRSDVGVNTTKHLVSQVNTKLSSTTIDNTEHVKSVLRQEMMNLFDHPLQKQANKIRQLNTKNKPTVLMIVGVNGVGKTTTSMLLY
jgi:fused signal recognition particle receptor